MVAEGSVRQYDLVGDDGADTAADLGRLRHNDSVISARRALLRTRRRWYPIVADLHKFTVVVSRIEVNHNGKGGTTSDTMARDKGGLHKIPLLPFTCRCGPG